MAISDLLNRRVRALPDEDEEVYSDTSASEGRSDDGQSDSDGSHGSLPDTDESQDEPDDEEEPSEDEEEEEDDEESEDDHPDDDVKTSLSNISFGALAKAQASLGPKNKRTSKPSKPTDDEGASTASPLDDIRTRIREAREQKRQLASSSKTPADDMKKPARSSKHAPMVQSSKRAVTRKRTIIEPPAVPKARDPRFDPTVLSKSSRHNPEAANKAYAFLDEYRSSELKELKEKYAKTKNSDEKEALKRSIRSMGDRLRAIENQKREKEILAEHKKKEKELIRQGKKSNPYYLKKSDLKKQVLLKKYENMNSKERMKALERRRKKVASKERKEMPMERRALDGDAAPANDGGRKRRRIA
ncbi:rRNA biogenesis protein rrp36 [Aspergillus ambiguus]|uniref:putative pre-rRNA processing protein n=1 Tax=Aspergillus ambiguus TaxID=176160 RepID=UPI003CCDA7B7